MAVDKKKRESILQEGLNKFGDFITGGEKRSNALRRQSRSVSDVGRDVVGDTTWDKYAKPVTEMAEKVAGVATLHPSIPTTLPTVKHK